MQKLEQIYEGKAKKVFKTDDPELLIVDYKDDATAFNGLKKGTILGKGVINNQMTNRLMAKMEKAGIPTHFVRELSQRETLVKRVSIVPLEVIVRNISAGSFAKRYGVEEGIVFDQPTIEFSYKNDALGDPLLNTYHALALKLATAEEIETIKNDAFAVNEVLKAFWAECGVTLVDFKLEFGKVADGYLCLFLFDDKGKIIGGQRAVSLNLSYRGTLSRSTDLNIVRTKFGNLFLAVDVDIYRPEILRAAALSGAEIILSSQFIPLYDYQSQKLGQLAFQAADNGVYIVNVSNASTSVIAPVETASCPGGFLVREDDSVPLFYSLDTGLYKKSSDPASPLARLRPALYEKYASYLGR